MDIRLWEGGLYRHEIEAIDAIEKAFSESESAASPTEVSIKSSRGGSLQDQLAATGLGKKPSDPMHSWKGYAGFRFVDSKGNDGEFDLLIVTHCNILVIELKDWNYGKITSSGDKWFKNDEDMGRSPVSVTRNKKFLMENKLKPLKQKFTNKGYTPFVHFLVVMCGNADISGLTDEEKQYTITLADFIKLGNEGLFNKRFRPHPGSKTLLQDTPLLDRLFFNNEKVVQTKNIIFNGYKAQDLIFTHPSEVYREHQAVSESKDRALLRVWDFNQLDKVDAKTPEGRIAIVSREKEVLQYIKDQQYDLYQHCLRSLTSVQKNDVTSQYCELYELPPSHVRFNEFIGKYGESFTEKDRINLVKLLVAKFADLHEMKIAHRDLGDHSIWIDPGKQIALSNFISAYYQPLGTIGDFREQLAVNDGEFPPGMPVSKTTTPFQADIYTLGLLSWHVLQAERISPKSLRSVVGDVKASNQWYSTIIEMALDGNSFESAREFFDELKEHEPVEDKNFDFDVEELSGFNRSINHTRQFPFDDDFLIDSESQEIYCSNGQLIKVWLKISPSNEQPDLGRKVLHFCQNVSKLQAVAPPYIPRIHEYGLATKSSSLFVLMDYIDGDSWGELSLNDEQKIRVIEQLISTVEHLHGLGLAHGDLHPENLKVGFNNGIMQVYLLDIPDFNVDSKQSFNHLYSPEAIDGSTAFERDIYAVMRLGCELLGVDWEKSEGVYPALEKAIELEKSDREYGFNDLARFKDAVSAIRSGESEETELVEIVVKGDFEPMTIYPDNGSLFVSFEKDKKDSSQARITFKGIGGQATLIYSAQRMEFIIGFPPRSRSTVSFRDIEGSQLELPFGISIKSSTSNLLQGLSKKVQGYEEFKRAIDSVLVTPVLGGGTDVPAEARLDTRGEVGSKVNSETIDGEQFGATVKESTSDSTLKLKKTSSQRISTAQLWQAILNTETESHPSITVQGEVQKTDSKNDELIVGYSSELNVLDTFNSNDDIEAVSVVDDKDVRLGKVLLRQSGLNEVRLTKLTFSAKKLKEDDVIYFRSKQDRASFQKRKNALERLLNREGLISNLQDYFDPLCDKAAISYPIRVSEEDFARYDRTDDHGNEISLNIQQREAFQKILKSGPLSLLQGPPGTGKTEFIAAFVHYLIEKQNVKNILLVSQSHEAVNTAAERIRKHCRRHSTPLEVVRFSNREGAVSQGLKDVYSNAIVSEKRELFRAEIGYRVKALSKVLGLQSEYLADLVRAEIRLFRLVNQFESFTGKDSSSDEDDKSAIKKSVAELADSIMNVLAEEYSIHDMGIDDVSKIKGRILTQLQEEYAIRPDESKRARALIKISIDMLEVLETDRVNYDEFLARSRQLVTGTCVGIGQWHIGVADNQYDWVIIDEAARSISSELAIAMQSAKRVLLVGDHKQLPPLYSGDHKKALARKLGITVNENELEVLLQSDFAQAFESGYGEQAGAKLLTQYRMAEPIGNLVSSVFYQNELLTGSRVIPNIYGDLPNYLSNTVTWLDTSSMANSLHQKPKKGSSIYNRCEADLIIKLLLEISENVDFVTNLSTIVKENEPAIGIICMYAEQKKLLQKMFREEVWPDNFENLVNIGTVDSYQGKENRIIVLSVTRNVSSLEPGFLRSPNRINVAISRAMDKLVIVGAADMWRGVNNELPLGKVVNYIEKQPPSSGYKLISKAQGVSQ